MTSMTQEKSALVSFFEQYEDDDFHYDSMMPATQQLKQLSQHMTHQEVKTAKFKFGKALAEQFSQTFGDELDSLESWQALCNAVKIDPVPDTLEEAQIAFKRTHVNLVELTDAGYNSNIPVRLFPTVRALSSYSMKNDLIFPRKHAPPGGLLCHLLRHISNPALDDDRDKAGWRGGRGRRRGGHSVGGRQVSGKS